MQLYEEPDLGQLRFRKKFLFLPKSVTIKGKRSILWLEWITISEIRAEDPLSSNYLYSPSYWKELKTIRGRHNLTSSKRGNLSICDEAGE